MDWCGSIEHTLHRRSFLCGTLAGLAGMAGIGNAAEQIQKRHRRVMGAKRPSPRDWPTLKRLRVLREKRRSRGAGTC